MTHIEMPKMPEFKVNSSKNGYEIRADILALAKEAVLAEYSYKLHGWEVSAQKDPNTGQYITTVGMPEIPGLDKVLEAAEKMYAFVTQDKKSK